MRLLPPGARVTADRLAFRDIDLLTASEQRDDAAARPPHRMILQDPKYSLNPVMPVGEQIAEA